MPTDYAALNKMIKRQRAALTRAKNSGDREKILATVKAAVAEWNKPGMIWPDDWADWQRTLDDVFGWPSAPDITDPFFAFA